METDPRTGNELEEKQNNFNTTTLTYLLQTWGVYKDTSEIMIRVSLEKGLLNKLLY